MRPNENYRRDIDGLRGVAISLVVIYHAFPDWLPGGFIGVDIFFVLSGYLITGIIVRQLHQGRFSLIEFYVRRIRRIFPSLVVVLTAILIVGWFLFTPAEMDSLGRQAAYGSIFLSNFSTWRESGYFDTSSTLKPLLHLWSLGIEEQFYLIFPLLVLGAWRLKAPLIPILVALGMASLAVCLFLTQIDPTAAFYAPWSRFWELIIGGLLALYINKNLARREHRHSDLLATIGISTIAFCLCLPHQPFPGWVALLPTVGTALIIFAGERALLNRAILSIPMLVGLGLISFPLYLWHWPLLSLAYILFDEVPAAVAALLVAVSLLLAWGTYRLVEAPLRFGAYAVPKAVFLCTGLAVVGVAGAYINSTDGLPGRPSVIEFQEAFAQLGDANPSDWVNDDCQARYPYTLAAPSHWFCVINGENAPSIVLVGNSFANHLYPGLTRNDYFASETILSIGICDAATPAQEGEEDFNSAGNCSPENHAREQSFVDKIIEDAQPKLVIMAGLHSNASAQYVQRITARLDRYEHLGIPVILVSPHWRHYTDISSCVGTRAQWFRTECKFPAAEREQIDREFRPVLQAISDGGNDVQVFDPNDLFCDAARCSLTENGIPLFRDLTAQGNGGHLSAYGSARMAELMAEWIKSNTHSPQT